jgi:hypothetical protein
MSTSTTTASQIDLVKPLGEGANATSNEIVLVANDQKTKFAVSTKTLTFYSKFAENCLQGEVEGEMPLDSDRASPEQLQLFCTWLKHHETARVSKIAIPIPREINVDNTYTDKWDLAFIRQHFVGDEEDMSKSRKLYGLALLAIYLQVQPLTEMICNFFAWHIKKAAASDDPLKEVGKWVNHPQEFTIDEVKAATDWMREALIGLELPERRTIDSDDEYSQPPMSTSS